MLVCISFYVYLIYRRVTSDPVLSLENAIGYKLGTASITNFFKLSVKKWKQPLFEFSKTCGSSTVKSVKTIFISKIKIQIVPFNSSPSRELIFEKSYALS